MNRALQTFVILGAVVLSFFGVSFLFAPSSTLEIADHTAEGLPQVMGGRYLFMAAVWAWSLKWGRAGEVALLLGVLGFIDAVIYWTTNPWPHLAVGAIAVGLGLAMMRRA